MERAFFEVRMLSPNRFVLNQDGEQSEKEFPSLTAAMLYAQNEPHPDGALLVLRDKSGNKKMQVRL